MRREFDCIVVGAGPAGSMAAKTMAENGVRVLLLEKDPVIGYPLCCGEGIGVWGMHQFFEPEPRWICAKVNRFLLVSPSGHKLEVNYPDAGYVLDRKIFDKELAIQAGIKGTEIKVNSCVTGIIRNKERITGVKAEEDGEEKEYFAKIIIAADGIESKVGRWAGIDNTLRLDQLESSFQYLVVSEEIEPERMEFYVGKKLAPGGYVWVFPKGENSANVGLGITPGLAPEHKSKELLDDFVKKRFSDYSIAEMMMGGIPTFSRKVVLVKGNLLLVGDAGRIVDSLSGAGIFNALLSGETAGEVACEYIKNGNLSVDFLRKYHQRLMKKRGRELRFYSFCRKVFLKMKDEDLDSVVLFLREYFDEKVIKSFDPFAVVKAIFKFNPKLLRLLKHVVW
jgi:digeranylgeranylglycerophospholipid reductase